MNAPSDAAEGGRPERGLEVRVVRGAPTDEELAAVLAVLQALAAAPHPRAAAPAPPAATGWDTSRRDLRTPLPPTWR